jgi:hypothetical protein
MQNNAQENDDFSDYCNPSGYLFIYDCFSYKPPKMDIAVKRKIGSYAHYDVYSLDGYFDNFVSYSTSSLFLEYLNIFMRVYIFYDFREVMRGLI